DQVCTHVGVMRQGRLLVQGPRDALGTTDAAQVVVTTEPGSLAQARETFARLGLEETAVDGEVVTARLGAVALADVAPALVAAGVPVLGLEIRRPTLEDLFVELTGHGFDVSG